MIEDYLVVDVPGFSVKRSLPLNLCTNDLHLFRNELERHFPPSQIHELSNCVISHDGLVVKNLSLYQPSLRHLRIKKPSIQLKTRALLSAFYSKKIAFKNVFFVSDSWSVGYFHWFCDTLPLVYSVAKVNADALLLMPEKMNLPFIESSLRLLGVEHRFLSEGTWVKAEKLVLHDLLAPSGNYYEPIMRELKNVLVSSRELSKTLKKRRRVFISRSKALRRRLLNETEINAILDLYGFESICMEEMGLQEQMQLMTETNILMGVHGAGLTNMLFMPEGSSVIEMRSESDENNNCYFSLSNALHHHYSYIKCRTEKSQFDHIGDFKVDLNSFEIELRNILDSLNQL